MKASVNMQHILQLYNCILQYVLCYTIGLCYTKCGDLYNMWCGIQYVLCYTKCGDLYSMCCVVQCMLGCTIVLYNICGVLQCMLCSTMYVVLYNLRCVLQLCCVLQYVL